MKGFSVAEGLVLCGDRGGALQACARMIDAISGLDLSAFVAFIGRATTGACVCVPWCCVPDGGEGCVYRNQLSVVRRALVF